MKLDDIKPSEQLNEVFLTNLSSIVGIATFVYGAYTTTSALIRMVQKEKSIFDGELYYIIVSTTAIVDKDKSDAIGEIAPIIANELNRATHAKSVNVTTDKLTEKQIKDIIDKFGLEVKDGMNAYAIDIALTFDSKSKINRVSKIIKKLGDKYGIMFSILDSGKVDK